MPETDIASLRVSGLKCDAPGCDYRDPTVLSVDYEKHLNAPCPRCGAPLLTQADLDATKALFASVEAVNLIAAAVGVEATGGPVERRTITMRGDGSVCISAPTIKESENA